MFSRNSEGFFKPALEVQANEEAIVFRLIHKPLLTKVNTMEAIQETVRLHCEVSLENINNQSFSSFTR
jgi:hypothetical protein